MYEIINNIIRGNIRFSSNTPNERFKYIVKSQSPKITLVMCSDSRCNHNLFGFETTNKIFTIENIGNQIKTAEGSVEYGILHLKTPVLMILGHTGCGAIKASLANYNKETPAIKKELKELENIRGKKWFKEINDELRESKFAEYNVDMQVKYAMKKFNKQVKNGELIIIGAMYDFHNHYGFNKGELYITNINGINDMHDIKKMNTMLWIDGKLRDRKVKRLE